MIGHFLSVTLNLFQGPSSLQVQHLEDGWMLTRKGGEANQVQHDEFIGMAS